MYMYAGECFASLSWFLVTLSHFCSDGCIHSSISLRLEVSSLTDLYLSWVGLKKSLTHVNSLTKVFFPSDTSCSQLLGTYAGTSRVGAALRLRRALITQNISHNGQFSHVSNRIIGRDRSKITRFESQSWRKSSGGDPVSSTQSRMKRGRSRSFRRGKPNWSRSSVTWERTVSVYNDVRSAMLGEITATFCVL